MCNRSKGQRVRGNGQCGATTTSREGARRFMRPVPIPLPFETLLVRVGQPASSGPQLDRWSEQKHQPLRYVPVRQESKEWVHSVQQVDVLKLRFKFAQKHFSITMQTPHDNGVTPLRYQSGILQGLQCAACAGWRGWTTKRTLTFSNSARSMPKTTCRACRTRRCRWCSKSRGSTTKRRTSTSHRESTI